MGSMVTLRDVAAHAGVSVSVVSRILNDDPGVRTRPETRTKILEAAKLLRYAPNQAGRSLRTSRSYLLALVVPNVTNATFTDLVRGVEDEALRAGYSVLLGSSESLQPGTPGFTRLLSERRVDGAVVQKRDGAEAALVAEAIADRSRVVLVNSGPLPGVATMALADERAGAVAARHLLDLGHREIGFLGGPAATDSSTRREAGVIAELAAAGFRLGERTTHIGYTYEAGRGAARLLLAREDPPTGIVAANVNAAFGAMTAAKEMGVEVPRDLSVVAIHDVWEALISCPALTTVRMPMTDLGRLSVSKLLGLIDGGQAEHGVIDEPRPEIVQRASTAPRF